MAFTFKHGDRPLDGYTIQRGVGRGGFGEVYYAISDGGREVALKYLRDNPEVELRGVSHCINLKSPHLVTIFDVRKNADNEYFIIMEYVSGPSLRDLLIAEPNGLGVQKAAFFMRELGKGLSYLHDRGIVHRDLKPGNIFYDDGYVKIGDYGLSKFISVSRHSAQTASVGTVHYMAPEVGSGNYSRGIDVYALGVILYEMLVGKVPFEGGSMGEVLMKHLTAQAEVDDLPVPFAGVIRKALAKDPNERYQTIDEMVSDIFGVEDVRNSLAGFSPTGLTQAAGQAARQIPIPPVPSPNPPVQPPPPPRQRAGPAPAAQEHQLPLRLSRRLRKVEERVTQKVDELDRKAGKVRPPDQTRRSDDLVIPYGPEPTKKGMVLAVLVALGISIVTGVAVGAGIGPDEMGVAAWFITLATSIGVMAGHRLIRRLGVQADPQWVQRLILMVCCTPGVGLGLIIVMEEGHRRCDVGALAAGLAAAVLFVNWKQRIRAGQSGELGLWSGFFAGLLAFIVAAVVGGGDEAATWIAGATMASVSLTVQAAAWLWPPGRRLRKLDHRGRARVETHGAAVAPAPAPAPEYAEPPSPRPGSMSGPAEPVRVPFGVPVEPGSSHAKRASTEPLPRPRWGIARAFWAVIAFCLFGGAVVTFLMPLLGVARIKDDVMGSVIGCVTCMSFMIFALTRTTQRRRKGFWLDTLRPFLISVSLVGIGAAITAMSLDRLRGEEQLGAIAGLIIAGTLFLVSVFAGVHWRRPRSPWAIVLSVLAILLVPGFLSILFVGASQQRASRIEAIRARELAEKRVRTIQRQHEAVESAQQAYSEQAEQCAEWKCPGTATARSKRLTTGDTVVRQEGDNLQVIDPMGSFTVPPRPPDPQSLMRMRVRHNGRMAWGLPSIATAGALLVGVAILGRHNKVLAGAVVAALLGGLAILLLRGAQSIPAPGTW